MSTTKKKDGLAGEAARAKAVFDILKPLWPEAVPLLTYANPFELLCAVVLSAQCTDEQVNRVTPQLFAAWPGPPELAGAEVLEVEAVIHSVGFFRTKARHLVEAARIMVEDFGGQVPDTMEGLLRLPGVGRKTANLVVSACFGQPGIIVDTHVLRVATRLGLERKPSPEAVEAKIAALMPREDWTAFSHALNRHGKFVCTARAPRCLLGSGEACPLEALCPKRGLKGRG